jgi:SNF2 family DNA or RNA helicase
VQSTNGLSVDIVEDSSYVVSGETSLLLDNPRANIALRRLGYELSEGNIVIAYSPESKISTLESLRQLAEKFDIGFTTEESVNKTVSAYKAELDNFQTFSNKARGIRNDDFTSAPELVEDFTKFKDILANVMTRGLYDLQMLSAFHMAFSQNACNFAVPGAGKTSIVYGAYAYLRSLPEDDPKHVDKLLVIGPLSSFAPWEKEYKKCFGVEPRSQRLSGDAKISKLQKERHLYSSDPKELTLMNHAGLQFLKPQVIDFLKQNKVLVVVDEAHRIKNADGIWGSSAVDIAKEATSRVILTGTPAPNGYEDLFNLIRFIYPYKYKQILNIHYGQLKELTKSEATLDSPRVAEFVENIKPFFMRIKKSDLNLPPISEEEVQIHMDSLQRKIYDFIEEKYIPHFESKVSATAKDALNKARLIRLRQAATNPKMLIKPLLGALEVSDEGSDPNAQYAFQYDEGINDSEIFKDIITYSKSITPAKFIAIKQLYEEKIKPTKGKVIIWTIFIQNADELQEFLSASGIRSRLLIGRIPQNEREEIVDKFNNPENYEFDVVIANPFSVSESISLHEGCHNAIYMERDYNASNFIQSKDRIHRVGLATGTITHYYYLVSPDSIDEVVHARLSVKTKRMEEIINEDIPLFQRIHDNDETDIITSLLRDYARRTQEIQ